MVASWSMALATSSRFVFVTNYISLQSQNSFAKVYVGGLKQFEQEAAILLQESV